jgi:hypothetical protein
MTILVTIPLLASGPPAGADWRQSTKSEWQAVFYQVDGPEATTSLPGHKKSVAKAVLLSAVLPGAGQFYHGSLWKGVVFLGIEAAALYSYFHFDGRGNDKEAEFEAYADQSWVEADYWDWLSDRSGIDLGDDEALRAYEHATFSHSLPRIKNQQYYENIGKYNQFNIGWEDAIMGGARDSEKRETYTFMRKDANDDFKKATNMLTIVLFNHTVSAFEAGLTTRKHNNRGLQARIRMHGLIHGAQVVPVLNLGVAW